MPETFQKSEINIGFSTGKLKNPNDQRPSAQ
jgi:hypothetical protein